MTDSTEDTNPLDPELKKPGITEAAAFRLLGLIVAIIGVVFFFCFAAWPIYQASNGARNITIYKKPLGIGIMVIVTGINGMIFGKSAFTWFPSGDTNLSDIPFGTWLALIANCAICVYAFMSLEGFLAKLGYNMHRV